MKATREDIEALVELFQASDWREMRLRYGESELHLSKDADAQLGAGAVRVSEAPSPAVSGAVRKSQAPAESPAPAAANEEAPPAHWVAVKAPNLGTFYRAPKPGAAPYVEIGQTVSADTEICLIEVMKLFTALKAGVDGTVKRICASDGELIESGQTLFLIEPNA